MKFTEAKLEQAIIELLGEQGYPHLNGATVSTLSCIHAEGSPSAKGFCLNTEVLRTIEPTSRRA